MTDSEIIANVVTYAALAFIFAGDAAREDDREREHNTHLFLEWVRAGFKHFDAQPFRSKWDVCHRRTEAGALVSLPRLSWMGGR